MVRPSAHQKKEEKRLYEAEEHLSSIIFAVRQSVGKSPELRTYSSGQEEVTEVVEVSRSLSVYW